MHWFSLCPHPILLASICFSHSNFRLLHFSGRLSTFTPPPKQIHQIISSSWKWKITYVFFCIICFGICSGFRIHSTSFAKCTLEWLIYIAFGAHWRTMHARRFEQTRKHCWKSGMTDVLLFDDIRSENNERKTAKTWKMKRPMCESENYAIS